MSAVVALPATGVRADTHSWLDRPNRRRVLACLVVWLAVSLSGATALARSSALDLVVTGWVAGLAWFAAGLVVWIRRPGTRFGPLMVAVGFVWFSGDFHGAGSGWTALFGFLFQNAALSFYVWLVFAYPTGAIARGYERVIVIVVVLYAWLERLGEALAMRSGDGWYVCNGCETPLFFENPVAKAGGNGPLTLVQSIDGVVTPALAAIVFLLIVVRFAHANPASRRTLAPVWLSAALLAAHYAINNLLLPADLSDAGVRLNDWSYDLAFTLIPVAFMAGMLQVRLLRGPIGRLVDELDEPEGSDLQPIIARALGDPTAEIFYHVDGDAGLTDALGRPAFPVATDGRALTTLSHRGMPLGVLVHDAGLLGQPELVASVCSAAGLALANERLRAQLRAQLAEVEASRARIVQATDAARRQVERDLHDGAQQRLVALRLQLRMGAALAAAGSLEQEAFLRSATELDAAIAELRELANGIHPSVLSDEGLGPALEVLVQRSQLPVALDCQLEGRLSEQIEAAAYFLVSEALSNAAKHAHATRIVVRAVDSQGELVVSVEDNGVGGASLEGGTGLLGLRDRVDAAGGRMTVASVGSGGSAVHASFPVGRTP